MAKAKPSHRGGTAVAERPQTRTPKVKAKAKDSQAQTRQTSRFAELAEICDLFGQGKGRYIDLLWMVRDSERSMGDLAEELGLSSTSAISAPLNELAQKGYLAAKPVGRFRHYSITPAGQGVCSLIEHWQGSHQAQHPGGTA